MNILKSNLKQLIKNIITPIIKEYWLSNYEDLQNNYKRLVLNKVKDIRNCLINNDFTIGEGTIFNIMGIPTLFRIDRNVVCRNYCNFLLYDKASLVINEGVFFNNFCSINCLLEISIGANTIFGEGVKVYDHNHILNQGEGVVNVSRNDFVKKSVVIGNNCWIGSNVTILQGVVIGDNVVIGANNLIYKSISSNSIVKAVSDKQITEIKK